VRQCLKRQTESIAVKCIFVFRSTLKLRQSHRSAICITESTPLKRKLPIGVWYHYTFLEVSSMPNPTPQHYPFPTIIPSLSIPSSNNAVTLPWWWSIWRIVNWVPTPLGLITALGLLQLIRIMAIISLIAIKGIAGLLSHDRRLIRRRRAAIIWIVVIIARVLLSRRFVSPETTVWEPTCSVHGSHTATTTAAVTVTREEECDDDHGDDDNNYGHPSSPAVPTRVASVEIAVLLLPLDEKAFDGVLNGCHS